MPKILIIESCVVNHGDDRGGVHQSAGDMPEVPKDPARALVSAGRALYINKTDDPDKQGRNTASREMVSAAEAMQKPARKTSPAPLVTNPVTTPETPPAP
jgi:hypothetical protein